MHSVYFIGCKDTPWTKVGYSNNVTARLRKIRTDNPHVLVLAKEKHFESEADARIAERKYRERVVKELCVKRRGEWVNASADDVVGLLFPYDDAAACNRFVKQEVAAYDSFVGPREPAPYLMEKLLAASVSRVLREIEPLRRRIDSLRDLA